MTTVAAAGSPPILDRVPIDEQLLRLNFSTDHVQDGVVIPNAIAVEDLKKRGYSLDREHLADIDTIRGRAQGQSDRQPVGRETPYLSCFGCGPVCQETDADGVAAFKVEASPREDNKAHAHILSAIDRGAGTLRKLRSLLVPHLNRNLMRLQDYTPPGVKTETTTEQTSV